MAVQLVAQRALPASGESIFQLLNSSYYKDSTPMLSVTGVVCNKDEAPEIQKWFKGWAFLNLTWEDPSEINVPIFSIKERLHLEQHMPTQDKTGHTLSQVLGYEIDKHTEHIEKLKRYEKYHQYYPDFARVSI